MSDNIDLEEHAADYAAAATLPHEDVEDAIAPPADESTNHSPRSYSIFLNFMSHFHEKSTPYPQEHIFSPEDLQAITPNAIVSYLNVKAFGKSNPGSYEKLISNWAGVEFIRKAIGQYMPQRDYEWDVVNKSGNPVKSTQVQCLMDRIRSLETRKVEGDINGAILPASSHVGEEQASHLRKMHARNVQFLHIVQTMDSTIKTLSKSVNQMKRMLESQNLQIRNEMIGLSNGEGQDAGMPSLPPMDHVTTASLVTRLKEEETEVAETLHELNNEEAALQPDVGVVTLRLGPDGYCKFYNELGKATDIPEGFELPTCDLIDAWNFWLIGFPNHKFRMPKASDEGEDTLVDAPIKPLRETKLGSIPSSLKKKYKDGWRPILKTMETDVEHMLEGVPPAEMDESFITATYTAAIEALIRKAPALFDGKAERSKSWKVATWSRKIREQMGGKNQRRSLDLNVKDEEEDVAMAEPV
jgi:hypothetical protein